MRQFLMQLDDNILYVLAITVLLVIIFQIFKRIAVKRDKRHALDTPTVSIQGRSAGWDFLDLLQQIAIIVLSALIALLLTGRSEHEKEKQQVYDVVNAAYQQNYNMLKDASDEISNVEHFCYNLYYAGDVADRVISQWFSMGEFTESYDGLEESDLLNRDIVYQYADPELVSKALAASKRKLEYLQKLKEDYQEIKYTESLTCGIYDDLLHVVTYGSSEHVYLKQIMDALNGEPHHNYANLDDYIWCVDLETLELNPMPTLSGNVPYEYPSDDFIEIYYEFYVCSAIAGDEYMDGVLIDLDDAAGFGDVPSRDEIAAKYYYQQIENGTAPKMFDFNEDGTFEEHQF